MVLVSPGHQRIYCHFAGLTRDKASYGVNHAAAALTSDGAAETAAAPLRVAGEVRCPTDLLRPDQLGQTSRALAGAFDVLDVLRA